MLRPLGALILVTILAGASLAASTPPPGHATSLWLAVGVEKTLAEEFVASDPDNGDALWEAKRVVKFGGKALRPLAKAVNTDSYVKETKLALQAVKLIETKLLPLDRVGDALGDAVDSVGDLYTGELSASRDRLAAASAKASALTRRLKRADKFLAKAEAAETRRKRYAALLKVAKATKGFSHDDPLICSDESGDEATWVISSLSLLDETQTSADLNGDGVPDNQVLAVVELLSLLPDAPDVADINALLAAELASSEDVVVIQMWGLDGFVSDPCAFVGLLSAVDTDGNPADNFDGTEVFDASASQGADGHAVSSAPITTRGDGAFNAALTAGGESIAFLPAVADGPIRIVGVAAAAGPAGVLVFAIGQSDLLTLIEDLGVVLDPTYLPLVSQIADVDVDGNGVNDSFSIALAFESVPCELAP